MKRVHKYGLEVVPTFEQAVGLKPAVQKPPALYKSWEEWNGFPLSNLRAQGEEIETQEELVLRKAQMEQVLTRIAHEHQMPREAVRGTLRTMAGSMGSGGGQRLLAPLQGGGPAGPGARPAATAPAARGRLNGRSQAL